MPQRQPACRHQRVEQSAYSHLAQQTDEIKQGDLQIARRLPPAEQPDIADHQLFQYAKGQRAEKQQGFPYHPAQRSPMAEKLRDLFHDRSRLARHQLFQVMMHRRNTKPTGVDGMAQRSRFEAEGIDDAKVSRFLHAIWPGFLLCENLD